jgi:hypothetical protein
MEQASANAKKSQEPGGVQSLRQPPDTVTPHAAHALGDRILDYYMPHASPDERNAARENLRRLAKLLIRVHERLASENPQPPIRGNPESAVDSESLP